MLLAGCASTKPPAPPLNGSRTAVRQAEQAGTQEYAPLELRTAREKLETAEASIEEGDPRKARILVEQAQVDAELDQIKARSAKSQLAVNELRESIQTLRDEIGRNENRR